MFRADREWNVASKHGGEPNFPNVILIPQPYRVVQAVRVHIFTRNDCDLTGKFEFFISSTLFGVSKSPIRYTVKTYLKRNTPQYEVENVQAFQADTIDGNIIRTLKLTNEK